jgi:tetratricopeptide (TPR) repeat protein
LFEDGQTAQQRGDNAAAVRHYTNALAADPSLYQAHYQRAIAYVALKKQPEAEADLRRVIQLAPDFPRGHRALGQLLLDRGSRDEAKRELARAIELDSKLTGVRIYYASALIKDGDYVRAANELRTAIQHGESDGLANALLGVAEERQGHSEEAFAAYSRAIELNPAEATAREGRGRLFAGRGDLARAIEDYSAAYRAQPSPESARILAELHSRAGQPQAAMLLYRQLATERPEDISLRVEIVRLLVTLGNLEEAAREVEVLLGSNPNSTELLIVAGDIHSKDRPDQAAGYYRRALALKPSNNVVRVQLAASLVRSRQFAQAIPIISDALTREPDNYQAHANLATALFELKQFPRAAAEFVWLVRTRPDVTVAYYFLAISFDRMGECEQALVAYETFLRKADPVTNKRESDDATIRVGLLRRLAKEGKCKSPAKAANRGRD